MKVNGQVNNTLDFVFKSGKMIKPKENKSDLLIEFQFGMKVTLTTNKLILRLNLVTPVQVRTMHLMVGTNQIWMI
jgi:hypothetical protein